MTTSTSALMLLRQLGSTVGLSVGQAIWASDLRKRLADLPQVSFDTSSANLIDSVQTLKNIQPPEVRQLVQHAYTKSIALKWLVDTPVVGAGVIMMLFIRKYTLKRKIVHAAKEGEANADADAPRPEEVNEDDVERKLSPDVHNTKSSTQGSEYERFQSDRKGSISDVATLTKHS